MDYLYSLHDALVSINVPNDKARAVVDAMERDMTTALATKADLLLVKQDLEHLRTELGYLKTELHQEIQVVKTELTAKIREETQTVTVRLGALIVGVAGLFATLKLI